MSDLSDFMIEQYEKNGTVDDVRDMAAEIRRRRAADLGDADREALRELMDAIAPGLRRKEEIWRPYGPSDTGQEVWRKAKRLTDALAVIESLIEGVP